MKEDFIMLESENTELKLKCMKVNELEDKVDLVLRHNQDLFIENEKLGKLLDEKIAELELMRRKFESSKREGLGEY